MKTTEDELPIRDQFPKDSKAVIIQFLLKTVRPHKVDQISIVLSPCKTKIALNIILEVFGELKISGSFCLFRYYNYFPQSVTDTI